MSLIGFKFSKILKWHNGESDPYNITGKQSRMQFDLISYEFNTYLFFCLLLGFLFCKARSDPSCSLRSETIHCRRNDRTLHAVSKVLKDVTRPLP